MKRKPLPPPEYLHECFEYRDGNLYWKERPTRHFNRPNGRHDFVGQLAGSVDANNRIQVGLTYIGSARKMYAHCIIWTMFNGVIPDGMDIDHDDGDTINNRIENLRLATGSQNNWNAQKAVHNTSGVKGVSWDKRRKRWEAMFQTNGKRVRVGYFDAIEEAEEALKKAREAACQEFTNHGAHKYDNTGISR